MFVSMAVNAEDWNSSNQLIKNYRNVPIPYNLKTQLDGNQFRQMNNDDGNGIMVESRIKPLLLDTHFERHRKKIKKYGKGKKKRRFIKHEYKRKDHKGKVKKTWLEDLKDKD